MEHLARRPAREREEQDAVGGGALGHEPRRPGGEGAGLARPGAGDDQERPTVVGDGRPLGVLESFLPARFGHTTDGMSEPAGRR